MQMKDSISKKRLLMIPVVFIKIKKVLMSHQKLEMAANTQFSLISECLGSSHIFDTGEVAACRNFHPLQLLIFLACFDICNFEISTSI